MTRLEPVHPGEVDGELHAEPGLRRRSECLRETVCHLDRDGRLLVGQLGKRLSPDAEAPGTFGDGQAERLQAVLADDGAGMDGMVHGHGRVPPVVVQVIDIHGVSVLEADPDFLLPSRLSPIRDGPTPAALVQIRLGTSPD